MLQFVQPTPSFSSLLLPTGFLDTRKFSGERVHTELILQLALLAIYSLHLCLVPDLPLQSPSSIVSQPGFVGGVTTYSSHSEISEYTFSFSACYASVLDLRGPGVAVHLRELELRLGARALGE